MGQFESVQIILLLLTNAVILSTTLSPPWTTCLQNSRGVLNSRTWIYLRPTISLNCHPTAGCSPLSIRIVGLFIYFLFIFYSKPRPFRRNSTIEQQCEQWAARIWKAALGNVAAGSIQLRRPEVSASTQERRAKYGEGGGGRE